MKNKRLIKFMFILIISFIILYDRVSNISFGYKEEFKINDNLEIYFFDVGQAESIFIRQRDNTVLIDAGNNNDGNNIVNYLNKELGIKDIDIVVGTHPHEDHIGGLDDVINFFDIGNIYMPDVISTSKTFEDVLDVIDKKGYYISVPEVDSEINLEDMKFRILYTGTDEEDLNNSSIVLRLTFGDTSYLFTGDATDKVENFILNNNIKSDVLKVGHHGSKYSSTEKFLNKVNPKYAIIMVGEDNSYGHPNIETLNKLVDNNIKVYRTDKDGTIKIISDGNNININKLNISLDGV